MIREIAKITDRVNDLEKEIKSMNECLKDNVITQEDVRDRTIPTLVGSVYKLQTSLDQANQQLEMLNHMPHEENMIGLFNTLKEKNDKQLEVVEAIHEEFGPTGSLNRALATNTRSVIDQVILDASITRDIMMCERTSRNEYICDFHVTNYSEMIGTGLNQNSRVWYIDQARSHIKAEVWFKADKTLHVWLNHGRHPTVVGLEPATNPLKVKVDMQVVTQDGSGDKCKLVNSKEMSFDESLIPARCDGWVCARGGHVISIDCEELTSKGLVWLDKVLLRFKLTLIT